MPQRSCIPGRVERSSLTPVARIKREAVWTAPVAVVTEYSSPDLAA